MVTLSLPVMIGLIACLLVVLVVVSAVGVTTLIKMGVIVRHAAKPVAEDRGSYTLDQGREVRPEIDAQPERPSQRE